MCVQEARAESERLRREEEEKLKRKQQKLARNKPKVPSQLKTLHV